MSTRSQWSFRENGKQIALIYKHSDGYPNGIHGGFSLWNKFCRRIIADNKQSMYDNRFNDAEYLAARFVVFLANSSNKLNFGGVGVSKELHGDIEYLYEIDCDNSNMPVMKCYSIDIDWETGKILLKVQVDGNNQPIVTKSKGSITIKGKTYNSFGDLTVPKKSSANNSYLKLKRDEKGKFIRMDNIAEFDYPHNGINQFRVVKIEKEDDKGIEGVQCNGENTGYKRFSRNKIRGMFRYKAYIKDEV